VESSISLDMEKGPPYWLAN